MATRKTRANQDTGGKGVETVIEIPAMLDAMADILAPPDDPGVTLVEMAERYGITRDAAVHRANRAVIAGLLLKGKARRNGKIMNVYRPNPEAKKGT